MTGRAVGADPGTVVLPLAGSRMSELNRGCLASQYGVLLQYRLQPVALVGTGSNGIAYTGSQRYTQVACWPPHA